MSTIEQQVRRAQRRLTTNVLMSRAALGIAIAAGLWALAILVERAFVLGIPIGPSLASALGLAVAVAVVGTYASRIARLQAALALDGAAHLKERVSTALTFQSSSDPFALAAIGDAQRKAGAVHVPAHIHYRAPNLWPWSLSMLAVAGILYLFMPTLDLLAEEQPVVTDTRPEAPPLDRSEVKLVLEQQRERMKKRIEDKPGLESLKDDLEALDIPDDPALTPEDIRRDVVKKVERVEDKLESQLESGELKGLEALKNELAKLETPRGDDAASKLAEALSEGDLKGAQQALEDLKAKLAEAAEKAEDDPAARAKLRAMEEKLADLSKQLEQLADTQKLQKELENKAGLSPEEAKKLLEKLAKMDPKQLEKALQQALAQKGLDPDQTKQIAKKMMQQQQLKQQLQQMAQAMQQAAQGAQQCQQPGGGQDAANAAMAALDDAIGQLSDLETAEQLMNELEAQLSDLKDLKQGVCQGNFGRPKDGIPQDGIGGQGPQEGLGYGASTGKQAAAHGYDPTKVKSKVQGGQIIGQMLIDGPQLRGEADAEAREAVNAAVRDATDAIEHEEVARQYQKVVRNYFMSLAGLMSGEPAAEEPAEGESASDSSD